MTQALPLQRYGGNLSQQWLVNLDTNHQHKANKLSVDLNIHIILK